MLMFWDALREAARRRQDKKNQISFHLVIVFLQKKTKREVYSEDKKEYLQKKKKTYEKSRNVFYFKFCYSSEIWHSIFELISASDILHLFFYFFVSGALGAQ